MARLTEEMVIARSRQSDLASVKKLNCWGAELSDVSLLQRMPNVEVLALSLNKIRSLSEFAHLSRLRELYVRKNEVGALSEVRHLRRLPLLTALWLDENPCAARPDYRHTVLRNLPQLTRLDDRPVMPDELEEAQRRGVLYDHDNDHDHDHDDDRDHDRDEEPERDEWRPPTPDGDPPAPRRPHDPQAGSPPRRAGGGGGGGYSPDSDERYEHPAGAGAALTRSYHERGGGYGGSEDERGGGGGAPLRHSVSAHSVKVGGWGWSGGGAAGSGGCMCVCMSQEYASANGDAPAPAAAAGGRPPSLCSPPAYHQHHHDTYYERPDRLESCSARGGGGGAEAWERESERERPREFASAVMAEHRGFTRRPVTRNSNLLSAVLCLVKELDYASLEVAEMAVRCRMDELAHGP